MLISFICSILEAVLMSTPLSYITLREEEGYKWAPLMKDFKVDSSRPIAAILSLNTIANTVGAAGVGHQTAIVFGSQWFGLVSAIVTVLILIFSEIIPKTIGTTYWKNLMGFATVTIKGMIFILYPVVICVQAFQHLITPKDKDTSISREEVGAMAAVAEQNGELDEDESEIIQNLISIDEVTAEDVMTPRVVAAIAPESMTIKAFFKDRRFSHHSRIPVYSNNPEYITGYVLRMDALQLMAEDKYTVTLGEIRRDVDTYQLETSMGVIWDDMLEKKEQIVVIIDKYGSFQGILTFEDVIETILGDEIVDERDAVIDMQELAKQKWQRQAKKK